jgi:hypothetical protein
MCSVEALAAGPEALERRRNVLTALADLFDQGSKDFWRSKGWPPLLSETIVGGIYEVVYGRDLSGETAKLLDLLPALTLGAIAMCGRRHCASPV